MSGAALVGLTLLATSLAPGSPSPLASTNFEVSAEGKGKCELPRGSGEGDSDLTAANLVAFSSRLIAAARAQESRRADRLFNDPFAELLAGRDAMQVNEYTEKSQEAAGTAKEDSVSDRSSHAAASAEKWTRMLPIRTRFCDDFFEDCVLSRDIKQVVSLGAGMDTRGLRLRVTPGTTVFEVDQPIVLRVKNNLLSKLGSDNGGLDEKADGVVRARVAPVEVDLNQAGWERELFEAGFDASLPSAWILEGLTMYLDEQELVILLTGLSKLCSPGSAFCATVITPGFIARAEAHGHKLQGEWKWGSDDPQAFFEATFPDAWQFEGVKCGTPGTFPDGADYSVGFEGKGATYVVGYLDSTRLESSSSEREGLAKGGL